MLPGRAGEAWFRGVRASGVIDEIDVRADPDRLRTGFWAVVGDFEGRVRAWRFAEVRTDERPAEPPDGDVVAWSGPELAAWTSSTGEPEYLAAVEEIRHRVRAGDVYQVNLCRVLSAPMPADPRTGPPARALAERLTRGNPAPYAGGLVVPGEHPVWVVSASPELFVRIADGVITSGPIKGTAATADGLTDKDRAENVMIADMVRNDLQRICLPGTVEVSALLALERHPGLVHLVTTVQGRLRAGIGWSDVLTATYPPASVSGAPKHAALQTISALEPERRGPYCGAFGWVDGDTGQAELAVAIRTFWWTADAGGRLHFGTGAGITWGSDPAAEWAETELKAARLVGLASASPGPGAAPQAG